MLKVVNRTKKINKIYGSVEYAQVDAWVKIKTTYINQMSTSPTKACPSACFLVSHKLKMIGKKRGAQLQSTEALWTLLILEG
jgi:hypothetical protein